MPRFVFVFASQHFSVVVKKHVCLDLRRDQVLVLLQRCAPSCARKGAQILLTAYVLFDKGSDWKKSDSTAVVSCQSIWCLGDVIHVTRGVQRLVGSSRSEKPD